MWDYISERVVKEAEYIIETGTTVRAAAAHFSISKSTVHKDVTERLKTIDKELFERVRGVLDTNLSERHIRGGMATKKKYCGERCCASGCAGGCSEGCREGCAGGDYASCAGGCAEGCKESCAGGCANGCRNDCAVEREAACAFDDADE